MSKAVDVTTLKRPVEAAVEALLRAADTRVRWKQPVSGEPSQLYAFLPGVYRSTESHNSESPSTVDAESGVVKLMLHGDNSFEYTWEMQRPLPRAAEYTVQLVGTWHKPVLNRTRRGDEDQRVYLTVNKMRFERLSNYDAENQSWKLQLRTLSRHGSDWAPVGQAERGVPPITIVLSCLDGGFLESDGVVLPAQVLTNSPACRVLAGLTKKVANKLGGPIDVMTEKWLPPKHMRFAECPHERAAVKHFNPFFCLAEALLQSKKETQEAAVDPL